MADFVHLHCHTEYSLLDGAIKLEDLCAQAVEFGLPAAAITDHGNLFGAIDFYLCAKKYGIKPIIGCEVYVAPQSRLQRDARSASEAGYHLVLLAQNQEGYHNLIKMVSKGFLEGFYYKPRVDKELLAKWNQGLIALSACLKGELPQVLMEKGPNQAREILDEYRNLFPGRFYLELQANGIPEQDELNQRLLELAQQTQAPLVATNDCHYLTAQDVEAHDILLCIQTNSCVQDQKRMRFDTRELYYRPVQEMEQAFAHCPQALENTLAIAEKCNLEIELGRHHFPVYHTSQGLSLEEELQDMASQGLRQRLQNQDYVQDEGPYWSRLQEELDIICSKGFASYFLIVQDFINWAKSQDIPVGPGRGSAAGSLVAYSLGITNLDPLRYNLLFERFLNVERESLPDIDVDFCYNRREEVIKYVTHKYGKDSVAQITTFGTMKAKAAIRDVGRALGMSFAETDRIAKLIPDELKMTIDKALEQEPELQRKKDQDPQIAKLIDISRRLEGLCRHASTHAAGIVISDKPMQEYLPLYLGKKGEVVTQYDMKKVEKVGLIKFDFLGLKTLTVLQDTLKLARDNHKQTPDLESLRLDDQATFDLLCKGHTDGVFQLESSGMRRVLLDLQPTCFEDIIALLALYRPGPLESGMVTDFVQRKHGKVEVRYPHPRLEPILKETHGVILYQEQVMRIASELANYSLGDGDILRRAMGKKDQSVMAKQRNKFLQGALENGVSEDEANYIFDLIEKFAGYGFNKSHSAAYALISYQTAHLKAHFPQEFMAALITSEVNNTDKVISHINACREMGIPVLQPDINRSKSTFSVDKNGILFGLAGIKNVGQGAIQEVLKQRAKSGPFQSLHDLCQRINLRKVSKRVLESLIKSGAMDCLGASRAALLQSLDQVVDMVHKKNKSKQSGQLSLLSMVQEEPAQQGQDQGVGLDIPEAEMPEFADEEKLRLEKETLGFFLSSHPLLRYKTQLEILGVQNLQDCQEASQEAKFLLAFLVTAHKEINTRKGQKMAFCQVEDLTATAELVLFPDLYASIKEQLELDQPLLCKARLSSQENKQNEEASSGQIKLVAESIQPLEQAEVDSSQPCQLEMTASALEKAGLQELKSILQRFPGPNPVQIWLHLEESSCQIQLGPNFCVSPNADLWREIEKWKAASAWGSSPNLLQSPQASEALRT
ncbi:MAG: DNA polymerase III subunit alpha [Thermodesulfobacteriota bacterium]